MQYLKSMAMPVLNLATRRYVAGQRLADAVDLAARAHYDGLGCTLCYWNDGTEDPQTVSSQYMSIVSAIGQHGLDGTLALKIPALWDREDEVARVVEAARQAGTHVMFDAHAADQSDVTLTYLERLGGQGLGLAIPGRWRRSLRDADRAIEAGAAIRVVKGQWPDPDAPGMDLREGYLTVIRHLAGRARFVSVATHDAPLAAQAMQILADAGTSFEQEFVFPLPIAAARREGARFGAAARLYIPYGEAWLPYSLKRALRNPRTFYWIARDMLGGDKLDLPPLPASTLGR